MINDTEETLHNIVDSENKNDAEEEVNQPKSHVFNLGNSIKVQFEAPLLPKRYKKAWRLSVRNGQLHISGNLVQNTILMHEQKKIASPKDNETFHITIDLPIPIYITPISMFCNHHHVVIYFVKAEMEQDQSEWKTIYFH